MSGIIITGPTGAIGISLIQKCIESNKEVLAICSEKSKRIDRIPKSPLVNIIKCDLSNLEHLHINGEYDIFYHLAWDGTVGNLRNDMYLQNLNVKYTLDAVNLAKRANCRRFIGAGSQAEYGRKNEIISPATSTVPENGYGIAKLCAGHMSRLECEKIDVEHIWVRIFSVYGPYDGEKSMIISTIRKLLIGEATKFTKCEQKWDYLYSSDAAEALLLLGEGGKSGAVYCLGSGKSMPLKEFVYKIKEIIDSDAELGIGEIPYGDKQVMNLCVDISAIHEDVGFVPKTSFEDGILNTIKWCRLHS